MGFEEGWESGLDGLEERREGRWVGALVEARQGKSRSASAVVLDGGGRSRRGRNPVVGISDDDV